MDAVSRPTKPYVEMSFGMGIDGFPAISMTQHAANKYAEWLSAKPANSIASRPKPNGSTPAAPAPPPSFTSETTPSQLGDYAWYAANSDGKYQKVATKKPNAWGLYDMLGNVMEWTLDQYAPYQPARASESVGEGDRAVSACRARRLLERSRRRWCAVPRAWHRMPHGSSRTRSCRKASGT